MTTTYDDLRAHGNSVYKVIRPASTPAAEVAAYWPPRGEQVMAVLSQPIQDLMEQGKKLGWANLGTVGNTEHLMKHGDHTPWSAGKARGILYAKDTDVPDWAVDRLIAMCRSNYDTSWIDFFNVRGRQYDHTGTDVGSSGDHHLHISIDVGAERRSVTLFRDLAAGKATVPTTPTPATQIPTPLADIGKQTPFVIKQIGTAEVWLTDGFNRRHVPSDVWPVYEKKYGPLILVAKAASYGSEIA